jgi:uncharacterized membrane protein YcaP (DUF421 family)
MELWTVSIRTVFLYLFIFLMMRLMGKREIGKLSLFDLIVSLMIADISAIVLEDDNRPLLLGVVPIALLVLLQILFSYVMLKNRKMRNWMDGEPTVIVHKGKILDDAMARARYNVDDLLMQLREKNIADVRDVEFAILETTGKLSVFPKEKGRDRLRPFSMPVPVIIDGKVQEKELNQLGQNRFWLKRKIQEHGFKDFKEIFYASLDEYGRLYIDAKEQPRRE